MKFLLIFSTVFLCIVFQCTVFENTLYAQSYRKPPAENTAITQSGVNNVKKLRQVAKISAPSNLPEFYSKRVSLEGNSNDSFIIVPEKKENVLLKGLRAGDILTGEIAQAITASPNVATPIRVKIRSGEFINSYVLGSASLDKDLNRVLIDVTRLRLLNHDTPYSIKGQVLSTSGEVGLTGEFHSKEMLFFFSEMLSAGAAGYMDATISRNQNHFSNYQTEPSVENAAKLGMVNALSKSADRFAEKQRSTPGYTTTSGFTPVQVIITEDPIELN